MLKPVSIQYGTDPEGFFERNGQIIGAEKVIPVEGLGGARFRKPDVVLDGVQFELNPPSNASYRNLAGNIRRAFQNLHSQVLKFPDVSVNFSGVVEVSRQELDSLSEKSRILGCMPSQNVYGERPITVDPHTYQKRSAGGHIHLGLTDLLQIHGGSYGGDERQRVVPILDIFVGNSCVLLDRDPGAAERRENYGRAGEFRLPAHGLEYRTLSNFWLRDYSLLSFAFGMAHLSVAIIQQTLEGENLEQELIDTVNIDRVQEAVNTNNWELARENFRDVQPFLQRHLPKQGFPLTPDSVQQFVTFAEGVRDRGLEHFFPTNPLKHWVQEDFREFNQFLQGVV